MIINMKAKSQNGRRSGSTRGSMLLESVLVLPLLFLLIMGVLQFAHIWTARHVVAYAAYCATRATLSVHPAEWAFGGTDSVAYKAAKSVCAWINVAGKAESLVAAKGARSTTGELYIPGWGFVPESDSLDRRLDVKVNFVNVFGVQGGLASATVTYRFPLVLPVAGSIISWFAKNDVKKTDDGKGPQYNLGSGWTGEAVVLDDEKKFIKRRTKDGNLQLNYLEKGVFPYIELTETCYLPMPYSTANFPISSRMLQRRAESLDLQGGGVR